jgi:hypothetical protein
VILASGHVVNHRVGHRDSILTDELGLSDRVRLAQQRVAHLDLTNCVNTFDPVLRGFTALIPLVCSTDFDHHVVAIVPRVVAAIEQVAEIRIHRLLRIDEQRSHWFCDVVMKAWAWSAVEKTAAVCSISLGVGTLLSWDAY